MTDIFEGIYSLWNNDATLKAALPRLYAIQAPDRATYPYGVFFVVTSRPDYTFERSYEHLLMQFSIYDDMDSGIATLNSIHDAMCDVYDIGIITDDDGVRYKMIRRRDSILPDPDGECYQLSMDFEIMKSV